MRASRAKTMPRQIAPTAITAQPISPVVPKRASAAGATKKPEPTMLPITSAVQVASPRLFSPVATSARGVAHSGSATNRKKLRVFSSGAPKYCV